MLSCVSGKGCVQEEGEECLSPSSTSVMGCGRVGTVVVEHTNLDCLRVISVSDVINSRLELVITLSGFAESGFLVDPATKRCGMRET